MRPTQDIHGPSLTSEAFRIVLDHIGRLEDTLHGAGLDIELAIAETVLPITMRFDPG